MLGQAWNEKKKKKGDLDKIKFYWWNYPLFLKKNTLILYFNLRVWL